MSEPRIPESCQPVLAALEQDALNLSPEHLAHLKDCPACAEARVLWVAAEEEPFALAPAGYFERLPDRVVRKLPNRRSGSRPLRFVLWAAAAGLLAAMGIGGFLFGRSHRAPLVEATLPRTEAPEVLPEAPFQDTDPLSQLQGLDEAQAQRVLDHLESKPARPQAKPPVKP